MAHLRYRSKEFAKISNRCIEERSDFCVEAHMRFWKDSIKRYIDRLHRRGVRRFNPISVFFCADLFICISVAFNSKKYDIDYSEEPFGLKIFFRLR